MIPAYNSFYLYLETLEGSEKRLEFELHGKVRFYIKQVDSGYGFRPDRKFWREVVFVTIQKDFEAAAGVCEMSQVERTLERILDDVESHAARNDSLHL
jgi:hypothetical protein